MVELIYICSVINHDEQESAAEAGSKRDGAMERPRSRSRDKPTEICLTNFYKATPRDVRERRFSGDPFAHDPQVFVFGGGHIRPGKYPKHTGQPASTLKHLYQQRSVVRSEEPNAARVAGGVIIYRAK